MELSALNWLFILPDRQ